ncbi:unnamed protein product [Urochloa humidicola]
MAACRRPTNQWSGFTWLSIEFVVGEETHTQVGPPDTVPSQGWRDLLWRWDPDHVTCGHSSVLLGASGWPSALPSEAHGKTAAACLDGFALGKKKEVNWWRR